MEFTTICGTSFYVDEIDAEIIKNSRCYLVGRKNKHKYVGIYADGKQRLLHRIILNVQGRRVYVDHKDGNGLNNRRINLRVATASDNNRNRIACGKSKFLGVHLHRGKYWQAKITIDGRQKSLGLYKSEIEAAEAYNCAASKFGNEFCTLNIIER